MLAKTVVGAIAALAFLPAIAAHGQDTPPDLTASLVNIGGDNVGLVEIYVGPNGLLIRAVIDGVEPGTHGFHIHETGLCEAPPRNRPEDPLPFRSSGGHLNPGGTAHGFLNEAGPHAGDLPNIHVPITGELMVDIFAPGLTVENLMDADGAAFIIHDRADDNATDTTGRSGGRIACGAIG
jgi:Cu-Zn family superoxide dismutase